MTRTGKIARLPRSIREELNRRMEDGEEGASLLEWLNSVPAVQKMLAAKFGGRPVSEQNLSAWRQGGYQDWLAHQGIVAQVEQLAANAEELRGMAKNSQLTEHLATLVAVRYTEVLANHNNEPDEAWERKVQTLRSLCRDVIAMRRSDEKVERLAMERERWSFERNDLEEKRVAKERTKIRDEKLAPFKAQEKQMRLAKVYGGGPGAEGWAARIAEITYDQPLGSVYFKGYEGGEAGFKARMEKIERERAILEGTYYEDEDDDEGAESLQTAKGQSQGESSSIKADQGGREAASPGSEFRVPGSELNEGNSPEKAQRAKDENEDGGSRMEDGEEANAGQTEGESSPIKADQAKMVEG